MTKFNLSKFGRALRLSGSLETSESATIDPAFRERLLFKEGA